MVPTYTSNREVLKVGGGAQGSVSQNCTSNPLNSLTILDLSRTLSNPCSPKNELNNPGVYMCVYVCEYVCACFFVSEAVFIINVGNDLCVSKHVPNMSA